MFDSDFFNSGFTEEPEAGPSEAGAGEAAASEAGPVASGAAAPDIPASNVPVSNGFEPVASNPAKSGKHPLGLLQDWDWSTQQLFSGKPNQTKLIKKT